MKYKICIKNTRLKILLSVCALLFVFCPLVFAGAGTTAGEFLTLGAGARPVSMGEAYAALAKGAEGLAWNPAGLVRIRRQSVTFMHAAYMDSIAYDYMAFSQRLSRRNAWGFGVHYYSLGRIIERDISGLHTGTLTPKDMAFALGFARRFRGFSCGVSGKFIQSTLKDSAQTGAVDLGLMTRNVFKNRMRLAVTVSHLGGKLTYEKEAQNLPTVIKAGSAFQLNKNTTGAVDVGFPLESDVFAAVGIEHDIMIMSPWSFCVRAGYNTRTSSDINGLSAVSGGFGAGFKKISVDYAVVPFGDLGNSHRLSLSYHF